MKRKHMVRSRDTVLLQTIKLLACFQVCIDPKYDHINRLAFLVVVVVDKYIDMNDVQINYLSGYVNLMYFFGE